MAMTIVENALCDLCRSFARTRSVASSGSTDPSTSPHSPFASTRCRIWNFQVFQLAPSSLSIDHFSSTPAMSFRALIGECGLF